MLGFEADGKRGGLAREHGITRKDVDAKELEIGIKVEMEHTDDMREAEQTALDHLVEHDKYYTEYQKWEKTLSASGRVKGSKGKDKYKVELFKTSKSLRSGKPSKTKMHSSFSDARVEAEKFVKNKGYGAQIRKETNTVEKIVITRAKDVKK